MTPRQALIWKEWNENFILFLIAIFLFIGLPIVGGMEDYRAAFGLQISAAPWVIGCGGIFAIIVAVGATCRDFSGKLEDFWRSRPVKLTQWLLVKYVVGLLVVLLACLLPLGVERLINGARDKGLLPLAVWFPFLWTALYSVGFLCGCLVRRNAHAAMLALGAMLLVYFLPLVLPPLQWMNLSQVIDLVDEAALSLEKMPIGFAAGMLGISISALVVAMLAVRREWRIESGPKLLFGSISAAILILFSSAAYQLGTNMPILWQGAAIPHAKVIYMDYDGDHGYAITQEDWQPESGILWKPIFNYRSLRITDSGVEVGKPILIERYYMHYGQSVSPPGHPEIIYHLVETEVPSHGPRRDKLGLPDENNDVINSLVVSSLPNGVDKQLYKVWESPKYSDTDYMRTEVYATKSRLYLINDRLVTYDITDPFSPKMLSDVPFSFNDHTSVLADIVTSRLPPVPDLTAQEKLDLYAHRLYGSIFDGDVLCELNRDNTLTVLKPMNMTEKTVDFAITGTYKPSLLESTFGRMYGLWGESIQLHHGLLYWRVGGDGAANPHITVLNVGGPGPIRTVGHFAVPGVFCYKVLPDGRCLVAGEKFWIVGPPPHRDVN